MTIQVPQRRRRCALSQWFSVMAIVAGAMLAGCWTEIRYSDDPSADNNSPNEHVTFRAAPTSPVATEKITDQNAVRATLEDPFVDVVSLLDSQGPTAPLEESTTANTNGLPSTSADLVRTPGPGASAPVDGEIIPAMLVPEEVNAQAANDEPPGFDDLRHACWLLGGKLTLAALADEVDANSSEAEAWWQEVRILAETLEVDLQAMNNATADPVSDYLIPTGRDVGLQLSRSSSDEHVALFEMAFKSNLLMVLIDRDPGISATIAGALARAGARSGLAADFWMPLVDLLSKNPSQDEVDQAVFALHQRIGEHLAAAEP